MKNLLIRIVLILIALAFGVLILFPSKELGLSIFAVTVIFYGYITIDNNKSL
jgi:hypothetical protein